MKKNQVALAALALFAGAASAQSSVTLFGTVDLALKYGRSSGGAHVISLEPNGINSSVLGFRGTEDLGGGLAASFWLEAGFSPDNGLGNSTNTNNQVAGTTAVAGLTFNRRSSVSLSGGFGELRLGRGFSSQFLNLTVFDPFGTQGVGTNRIATGVAPVTGVTAVRVSNAITYLAPANLGGFYGQVQYYLGENLSTAANSDDGRGAGFRVGFANGPIDVAIGYGRTEYLAGDTKQSNLGASYNFGVAKLMAQLSRDENNAGVGTDGKGWLLGAIMPVGAGEVRVSYSVYETQTGAANPEVKQFAMGYVHHLSKRTALYATIGRLRNSGGAVAALNMAAAGPVNSSSTGYDFGLRHAF